MALQGSGQIKLSEIVAEFGGSAPHALSEYYAAATGVPASGAISFSNFYGTSASATCTECTNQIPDNFTWNAGATFSGSYNTEHSNFALNTTTGTILASYTSTSGGTSIVAITRSGDSFTLGSPVQLNGSTDVVGRVAIAWIKGGSNSKFVVAYNQGSGAGKIKALTVTGTSIAIGSAYSFSSDLSNSEIDIHGDPHNDDKFLLAYSEKLGGPPGTWWRWAGKLRAGSLSTHTVTLGTVKDLDDGDNNDEHESPFADQVNFFVRHDPHTSGKFIITYANGWNYQESGSSGRYYFPMIRSGDISGTTISWHNTDRSDDVRNHTGAVSYQMCGFEYLTDDRFVIIDRSGDDSWAVVGTFDYSAGASSSGTIDLGSSLKFCTYSEPISGLDDHSFNTADYGYIHNNNWKTSTVGAISNPLTLAVCPLHTGDDIFVVGARAWLGYDYGEEFYFYILKATGTDTAALVTTTALRLDDTTIGSTGAAADGVPQIDFKLLPAEDATHTMVFMTREQTGTYGSTSWSTTIPDSKAKLRTFVLNDD
jgi:hypothetical protein